MLNLNILINSISLPLQLPKEAFLWVGKAHPIPNFDLVFYQLPVDLIAQIDLHSTAITTSEGISIFPLLDGTYLRMEFAAHYLIALSRIGKPLVQAAYNRAGYL
ncbi:MAG: hypothetical protein AB1489_39405 [Acidobacteriota bacterium]